MELLEGKNNFGASPFFFAIAFGEHGGLEAARALLSAGADIKEMASKTYMDCYKSDMFDAWEGVTRTKKPVIAAVNGNTRL